MHRYCMRLPWSLCSYLQTTHLASYIDMKICATSIPASKLSLVFFPNQFIKLCASSQCRSFHIFIPPRISHTPAFRHGSWELFHIHPGAYILEYEVLWLDGFTSTNCSISLAADSEQMAMQLLNLLADLALLLIELLQLLAHLHDSTFHNIMVALQLVILAADHHRINPGLFHSESQRLDLYIGFVQPLCKT